LAMAALARELKAQGKDIIIKLRGTWLQYTWFYKRSGAIDENYSTYSPEAT
jgi:hypothetical protein